MGFAVVEQNMYFRSIAIEDNLIKSSHLTFKKVIFGTRPQYSEWTVGPHVQHVPLCLCNLLATTGQFRLFIGQKMQLTG